MDRSRTRGEKIFEGIDLGVTAIAALQLIYSIANNCFDNSSAFSAGLIYSYVHRKFVPWTLGVVLPRSLTNELKEASGHMNRQEQLAGNVVRFISHDLLWPTAAFILYNIAQNHLSP